MGNPHVLQQKETEIELLKKRIPEAPRQRRQGRSQQIATGSRTPQRSDSNANTGSSNSNSDIASKVDASIQVQQLIKSPRRRLPLIRRRLAETRTAELKKTAELKHNEAESRRLRREKIATDLPLVDAEVQETNLSSSNYGKRNGQN